MGSRNQTYKGGNPNMVNYSFSAPKTWTLAIEMLVERGIYQSKSEVIRAGVKRILKDCLHILDSLKGIIKYEPISREKQDGNTRYMSRFKNGYEIIELKGMNEE